MKAQISRLSPYQNAKVFGVVMALSSLLFVVPMVVAFSFIPPGIDAHGNPGSPSFAAIFWFPIAYLVMNYILVAVGCALYNFMFKYLGGFEYELRDQQA